MTELTRLLPAIYRTTGQDSDLQAVLEQMDSHAEEDTALTMEQLIPSTVSVGWGLRLWEQAWGIPTDATKSIEQRQERILAKIKGTKTTTKDLVAGIAESFSDYPVEIVEIPQEYRFVIRYVGTASIDHSEDLVAIVNELRPAHLGFSIGHYVEEQQGISLGAVSQIGEVITMQDVDCSNTQINPVYVGAITMQGEYHIVRQVF